MNTEQRLHACRRIRERQRREIKELRTELAQARRDLAVREHEVALLTAERDQARELAETIVNGPWGGPLSVG